MQLSGAPEELGIHAWGWPARARIQIQARTAREAEAPDEPSSTLFRILTGYGPDVRCHALHRGARGKLLMREQVVIDGAVGRRGGQLGLGSRWRLIDREILLRSEGAVEKCEPYDQRHPADRRGRRKRHAAEVSKLYSRPGRQYRGLRGEPGADFDHQAG